MIKNSSFLISGLFLFSLSVGLGVLMSLYRSDYHEASVVDVNNDLVLSETELDSSFAILDSQCCSEKISTEQKHGEMPVISGMYLTIVTDDLSDERVADVYQLEDYVRITLDVQYLKGLIIGDYIPIDFIDGESYLIEIKELRFDGGFSYISGGLLGYEAGYGLIISITGDSYEGQLVTPDKTYEFVSYKKRSYLAFFKERNLEY